MTVTELRIAEPVEQSVAVVPKPREQLLQTNMTLNLHVNEDTRIGATRHAHLTGEEYLSVAFVDPRSNYGGVTVFLSDDDVIRLIDALQSVYPAAS